MKAAETSGGSRQEEQREAELASKLPKAKRGRDWKAYLFWVVPAAAVALAAWFIYSDAISKGPKLHLYFADATGLDAGKSKMKYRGAEVGKVDDITLTPDRKQVDVEVSLKKSAAGLARENSKFWIVRAQVSVAQIQGLGTIMSGDFLTVEPGDGKAATKFEGLAQAPVIASPGGAADPGDGGACGIDEAGHARVLPGDSGGQSVGIGAGAACADGPRNGGHRKAVCPAGADEFDVLERGGHRRERGTGGSGHQRPIGQDAAGRRDRFRHAGHQPEGGAPEDEFPAV
ncbi:MAG TPA: MlaD family protein [Phycisphaerae bacterium]|nr:MlaD family protein [Phycisphaerae bacterium]